MKYIKENRSDYCYRCIHFKDIKYKNCPPYCTPNRREEVSMLTPEKEWIYEMKWRLHFDE